MASNKNSFVDEVVNGDRPVMLLPGGAFECEKPLSELYKLTWLEEPGFARLLLEEPHRPGQQTSVIPFYTNNCESIYFTSNWWYDVTGRAVRNGLDDLRNGKYYVIPMLVVLAICSLGFVILPRPVKLDLHLGSPIIPHKDESAKSFSQRVKKELQKLVDRVVKDEIQLKTSGEHEVSCLDMFFNSTLYTIYTVVQNTIFLSLVICGSLLLTPVALLDFCGNLLNPKPMNKRI